MKHKSTTLFAFLICIVFLSVIIYEGINSAKKEKEEKIDIGDESLEHDKASENPIERWRYEFEMLKDPKTGKIPEGIRIKELQLADKMPTKEEVEPNGDNINTYAFLGPNNIGGRTRAVTYDKYDPNIILAGGVSTGVYRSNDGGATWTNVTPNGEIHNVTCITQDPRLLYSNIWYYGTGESYNGESAQAPGAVYFGDGIFRSTDNGVTWNLLQSTRRMFANEFNFITRIAINPVDGKVYAACHRTIMSSSDGGESWNYEWGGFNASQIGTTDVACNSAGTVIACFDGRSGFIFGGIYIGGVWKKQQNGIWVQLAGRFGPNANDVFPNDWDRNFKRVIVAFAPSNNNIFYILYNNSLTSNCDNSIGTGGQIEADLFKYSLTESSWEPRRRETLPDEIFPNCYKNNTPFAVQSGYDMALAVKPDSQNVVLIGGTNAYRSGDGFLTNTKTRRIGGYKNTNSYTDYDNHHPDIHFFAFHPTDPKKMICGSDGGVHITNDIEVSPVVWAPKNNGYITTQFYYAALSPQNGNQTAIGGTQDNGTIETGNNTPIWGGDGCAVGISKPIGGNTYYYFSTQANPPQSPGGNVQRKKIDGINNPRKDITPADLGAGLFITYFLLDPDNTEFLYFANGRKLYRTKTASIVTDGGAEDPWAELTGIGATLTGDITAMAVTRDDNNAGRKLYIGTMDSKLYRLNDPRNVAPNASTPTSLTNFFNGAISDIAVDPIDDKKVLVVFSSYGISGKIQYSINADVANPTWTDYTGNFYDFSNNTTPSIRSCEIVNRGGTKEYYVGTSIGLYSSFLNPNYVWVREGETSLGKALVRSLDYRPSDNALLIGTHGNGMFYTTVNNISVSQKVVVTPNLANYNTLKAAFDQINAGTHTNGAVTVKINSSTTETAPAVLNGNVFTSCVIQPTDYNVTINGDFNDAIVVLDRANNVTIEGRVGATGTNSHLKFKNINTELNAGTIRMSNGASNNSVKYVTCVLTGANATVTSGRNINIAQSVAGTSGNNNNTIENCIVNGGRRGIQTFGTAGGAGFTNNGTIIRNNIVKNCTSIGVFIGSETRDNTVEGNSILNDTLVTTDGDFRGINNQGVGTTNIKKNKIRDLNSDTTVYAFQGILSIPITLTAPGANNSTVNVENNFVSICDDNTLASFIYGIHSTSNANTISYTANIYYNSVRIGGFSDNNVADYSVGIGEGITGNGSTYNQFNNIVLNKRTGGNASSYHIGSYIEKSNGVTYSVDYNIYKADEDGNLGWDAGWDGFLYRNQNGLLQYQAVSNQESHTAFQEIQFVSLTDLHLSLSNPLGNIAAKPIAGITTDIDNQNRNATHPYRGADEIIVPLKLLRLVARVQGCIGSVRRIILKLINPFSPCVTLTTTTAELDASGIGDFYYSSVSSSFYIEVSDNRNIIRTYSASPQSFTNDTLLYDFTTSSSQAFGSNMVFENGDWSFYTGDVNQDGVIDGGDGVLVDNDAFNFVSGDVPTDLTCDEIVDGSDVAIADNNAFSFIGVVSPPECSLNANVNYQNNSNTKIESYTRRIEKSNLINNSSATSEK